jgi:hypothetical protein
MRIMRGWRIATAAVVFSLGGVASATGISYTGSFSTDDQLQYFQFTASNSSVIINSLGYGGGTNVAGSKIPAGGFAPFLSLFDETGGSEFAASNGLIASTTSGSVPGGGCSGNPDPSVGGACLDVSITEGAGQLIAGQMYLVVLSEVDNSPNGNTFGAGFSEVGNGDFTGPNFGCTNNSFCDPFGNNRTANYAVDITVNSAATVPEPGTEFLLLAGIAAALVLRKQLAGAAKH